MRNLNHSKHCQYIIDCDVIITSPLHRKSVNCPGKVYIPNPPARYIFPIPNIYTLLEIYFGGDKCRNFGHFADHLVPKIISAENYLRRIFISAEYLSPPNIYLRRIYMSAEYLSPSAEFFFPFFLQHYKLKGLH